MTSKTSGATIGQQIDEVIARMEKEIRGAAEYVNDAVVPPVRKESIAALRTMSETLNGFADRLEKR